ncbi:hypothetical protein BDQ17DRAFT_464146 [Cyathus striatus]|nr:hypothetical protein BDQ17DRAFT_464146 [Cyathus striatus]
MCAININRRAWLAVLLRASFRAPSMERLTRYTTISSSAFLALLLNVVHIDVWALWMLLVHWTVCYLGSHVCFVFSSSFATLQGIWEPEPYHGGVFVMLGRVLVAVLASGTRRRCGFASFRSEGLRLPPERLTSICAV